MSEPVHDRADDVAAYLLGSLGELEAQAFERHLTSCAVCHDELEQLRPAAEALPRSVTPLVPPAGLKQELLKQVRRDARRDPAGRRRPWRERLPSPVRMRPVMAWISAAFLLAAGIVTGLAVTEMGDGDGGTTIAAEMDSVRAQGASGSLLVPEDDGEGAVLRVHGMPPLAKDESYQVWLARGDERIPQASLFNVRGDGDGSGVVSDRLRGADAVLVTREPAGGSPRPTHEPVLQVPLDGS